MSNFRNGEGEGEVAFFSAKSWTRRNRADSIGSAAPCHDPQVVGWVLPGIEPTLPDCPGSKVRGLHQCCATTAVRPLSYSNKESKSNDVMMHFEEFSNEHIVIQALTPFDRTLRIKVCKNNARSRVVCGIGLFLNSSTKQCDSPAQ